MRSIGPASWLLALSLAACSGPAATGDDAAASDAGAAGHDAAGLDAPGSDAASTDDAGAPSGTLAEAHPGDLGMGADPDVIWFEDFEEGSLAAVAARYDQARDNGRWAFIAGVPAGSGSALALTAGQGQDAVDLYKQLPSSDEWYVRWYAHYQGGVHWHHSGMWLGGYAPAMPYPSPNAGLRPNGDDRFSIAIEPVYDVGTASARFDFYDYWSTMHSWMAPPIVDDGTAYYGNAMVHRTDFTVDEESWVCLETHVRLNTSGASGAGAVLEVWKNDALVQRFDDAGPMGYWIRDKFCPEGADGTECTDYPAPFDTRLDLTLRTTTALQLNAFWPQNYITDPEMGTLAFDQMVVATRRVGCLR